MKVLVINAGSSSLKYQLLDMTNESVIAKGGCERIGLDGAFVKHKANGTETKIEKAMPNHSVAIDLVLNTLMDGKIGVIKSLTEIDAFGHRVVHGAETYTQSKVCTAEDLKVLKSMVDFAPLHLPANILGIEACQKVAPQIPNVMVFDTSFHRTMPKHAYLYALPLELYKEHKIRRYGFHGMSHMFVSEEMAKMLNKPVEDTRIVTCHLGNGASISAVKGGKCIDTSMGFTPLQGVVMGTRSGDIDPALVEVLMKKTGLDVSGVMNILNKKSGLLGIFGTSSDMRDITEDPTLERAKLALEMMAYSVKKYIGAYSAAMGGVDAIVFTAGIGEYTPELRELILNDLEYLGVEYDNNKNYNAPRGENFEISTENSKVKVVIIPTNEELVIARETQKLVK